MDHILLNYSITHSTIYEFIHNLASVTPRTGSLKISFSLLSKIGHKHLEKLYLLCQFKGIEVDYEKAFKISEK